MASKGLRRALGVSERRRSEMLTRGERDSEVIGKGPDTVQIDKNRDIIRASVKLSWSAVALEHFKQTGIVKIVLVLHIRRWKAGVGGTSANTIETEIGQNRQ